MRKTTFILSILVMASTSFAGITGVAGPLSSQSVAAEIIGAPTLVINKEVYNKAQQGFDEAQAVTLGSALSIDGGGTIAAGTTVDSHMIFMNQEYTHSVLYTHSNVVWTFDGLVIGVMSDSGGNLEAASTPVLGAPGSTYEAPLSARGLEGNDGYVISGNTLTVNMLVTQPGDWIRVVTTVVPAPGAVILGMLGLGAAGAKLRRRRRA